LGAGGGGCLVRVSPKRLCESRPLKKMSGGCLFPNDSFFSDTCVLIPFSFSFSFSILYNFLREMRPNALSKDIQQLLVRVAG
jgi:hypothetical protein